MINITIIQNIPQFSKLHKETCQAIARRAFKRDIPAGQTVVIEGLPAEFCYFILTGDLRVIRMNLEGRVQVMARLKPGTPFNIISLLVNERTNRASVETLSPSSVLVLAAADFDELLTTYPDFSALLLKIFAQRMAKMTDLAAGLSLFTVRARLAQFLIELADQPQTSSDWTQDEIAAHIGTVRDVVGRFLRAFEDEGLITRHRQEIILRDREGLLRASEREYD